MDPICSSVITFLTYHMYIYPILTELTSDHTAKYKDITQEKRAKH